MASEKELKVRVQHKHDIEANWIKAENFIPKQGEIIIYDADENFEFARAKIGDGVTLVNDLPFVDQQKDWNQSNEKASDYIRNKTHYDGSYIFNFDGNLDGKIFYPFDEELGTGIVKISDSILTVEQLIGANLIIKNNTDDNLININIKRDQIEFMEDGNGGEGYNVRFDSNADPALIVVVQDLEGITPGLYFIYSSDIYVSELNNQYIKELDKKYLPNGGDGIGYYEPSLEKGAPLFNGDLTQYETRQFEGLTIAKVADTAPTMEQLDGVDYVVMFDDGTFETHTFTPNDLFLFDDANGKNFYASVFGSFALFLQEDFNTETQDGIIPAGTWYCYDPSAGEYIMAINIELQLPGTLHKINSKYLPTIDWAANGGDGYIRNRTHWVEYQEVIPETEPTFNSEVNSYIYPSDTNIFEENQYYKVIWNGVEYRTKCGTFMGYLAVGNLKDETGIDTKEPFIIGYSPDQKVYMVIPINSSGTLTFSIYREISHKLGPEYLSIPDAEASYGEEGYIANRPLYRSVKTVKLVEETILTSAGSLSTLIDIPSSRFIKRAIITFDGVEYLCSKLNGGIEFISLEDKNNFLIFGNPSSISEELPNNFLPFAVVFLGYDVFVGFKETGTHTIEISLEIYEYHKDDVYFEISHSIEVQDFRNPTEEEVIKALELLRTGNKVYGLLDGQKIEVYDGYFYDDTSALNIKGRDDNYLYEYEDLDTISFIKTLRHPQPDFAQTDETAPDYIKNRDQLATKTDIETYINEAILGGAW